MSTIQVFDPALCCSSGVCGVDVDQQLVSFAADVDWARQNGAQIERFNLAQLPQAFARNAVVSAFLESTGHEALPLILVDEKFALAGGYPTRTQLAAWAGIASAPPLRRIASPASNTTTTRRASLGWGMRTCAVPWIWRRRSKRPRHAPCSNLLRVTWTRKRRWPPSTWSRQAARKLKAVAADPMRVKPPQLHPNAAEPA